MKMLFMMNQNKQIFLALISVCAHSSILMLMPGNMHFALFQITVESRPDLQLSSTLITSVREEWLHVLTKI